MFADLDLEAHTECSMDYVEVFDGSDTVASKSLGRFCTSAHPALIRSSTNHVAIKFRSDISVQGRGFLLQYSTVCGNTVHGFRGVIESPNFPNPYPHIQDCRWTIQTTKSNKINITFSHFDIERVTEQSTNCSLEYVEVSYTLSYIV